MRRLYTIDQFSKLAEAQQRDAEVSIASASLGVPEFGESGRLVRYVFSTPAVGRDLHTVARNAWQLQNYLRNPVFLWAHDDTLPPIGRVVEIGDEDGALKGTVEYADRDLNPFADTIYQLVRAKYLNAVSTSWQPLKWSFARDKDRPGGVDFAAVDLLEISQVPIPALPEALAEARSRGIDTSPIVGWAERLLDTEGMSIVPRTELELLRRSAQMTKRSKEPAAKPPGENVDETAALKAKHARALTRAPKVPVFRRGLYQVAQLAYVLNEMGYCHSSSEYEAALEEDDSPVPGMLGEAMVKLGEALIAMTQEEVAELLDDVADGDDGGDDIEVVIEVETRSLPAETQAFIAAGATPRARAWRAGIAVARAGKALSSSNEEKLQDAQGHHQRAMKHSRALGEHHAAVADHLKKAGDASDKASDANDKVGEHLQAAQDNPDEAQTHVKRAAKAQQAVDGHLDGIDSAHDDLSDRNEDVGDSHRAMGRCVQSAQRCVRSVVDGAQESEPDEDDGDEQTDKNDKTPDAGEDKARRLRRAKALQIRGAAA